MIYIDTWNNSHNPSDNRRNMFSFYVQKHLIYSLSSSRLHNIEYHKASLNIQNGGAHKSSYDTFQTMKTYLSVIWFSILH